MENNLDMSQLVFPRDKTSHSTSWDNLGEDVPGQKYLAGVKNSRTNTSTITTWLAKKMSKKVKNCIFLSKFVIFLLFFSYVPRLVPQQAVKIQPIPSCIPSQISTSCPGLSHPVARFWPFPVVPLSQDNEGTSVPLSWKAALSHLFGNTSLNHT